MEISALEKISKKNQTKTPGILKTWHKKCF